MKRRIAVLGGGCGSMAAVWALTQLPGWEEKYEITVYQMGWRLGGKGASGRDEENSWRILEHGLHVWGGFYENAFRVMQQCYAELPPDSGNALPGWDDAFRKLSNVILQEDVGGKKINWRLDFPENDEIPGHGGVIPSPWGYVQLIVNAIRKAITHHAPPSAEHPLSARVSAATSDARPAHESILRRLFASHYDGKPHYTSPPSLDDHHPADIAGAAATLAQSMPDDPGQHAPVHHDDLLHLVEESIRIFAASHSSETREENDALRRIHLILDLAGATIRGILRNGVLLYGFEAINDREWREWLRENGAAEATINSCLVRGIYDYVFGFVKGVQTDRSLEAGTGTYGVLRLFFTYKGAMFWEMQAGMGDIVFAPLYRVLRRRGVEFRFFHKVTRLDVGADGSVSAIEMLRQATVKDDASYEPLVIVNGVHSWPAHPRFAQLEEGDELRERRIDLESAWADWSGTPLSLERGRDFDDVVLGISIAALPEIAAAVRKENRRFDTMLEKVRTVQTASMQLWFDADAERLGAPVPRRSSTACTEPLATWSDMSFLLQRERWSPDSPPRYLAYFCGELADPPEIPPYSDHQFPERMLAGFRELAQRWLEKNTGSIWSRATSNGEALDWSLLHDPENRDGAARLDAQFFRVNIDPTERYVGSFPGTSRYRMRADQPVLPNLFITGDWVWTPFNAGCVEAAVMAGMYAARAISGETIEIVGG
jgi:uncharacterized protein with NAD-binding domain and iron-sulfur cluster